MRPGGAAGIARPVILATLVAAALVATVMAGPVPAAADTSDRPGAATATALVRAIAATMTIDGPSRDPAYGYTPATAVPVGGGAAAAGGQNFRAQVYFKLIAGPLGEDMQAVLQGRCCADAAGGTAVSAYTVALPGRRPFRMYLAPDRDGPLLAPVGLAFARTLASRLTLARATRAVADRLDHDARRLLAPLAQAGEPLALYYQALLDRAGRGGPADPARALAGFQAAAARGHGPSHRVLAESHAGGIGVPRRLETAIGWYRRAALAGDREAQAILASRHLLGDGVAADPARALFWARAAADRGLGEAQMILASMLLTGAVDQPREDRGLMWLVLAARAGSDRATARLDRVRRTQPAGLLLKAEDAADRWQRSLGPPPVPDLGAGTGVDRIVE